MRLQRFMEKINKQKNCKELAMSDGGTKMKTSCVLDINL